MTWRPTTEPESLAPGGSPRAELPFEAHLPFSLTRRQILLCGSAFPLLGALIALPACGEGTSGACVDPAAIPASQRRMRESLHYVDRSPDPDEQCGGCALFEPEEGSACGTCKIFAGTTSASGRCDSWSARA